MIILDCQLTEQLNRRKPCYTFVKSNIVVIISSKEYCALNATVAAEARPRRRSLSSPLSESRPAKLTSQQLTAYAGDYWNDSAGRQDPVVFPGDAQSGFAPGGTAEASISNHGIGLVASGE